MVNLKDKNGRSLYFVNRKEYYRRIKISQGLKKYYATKKVKPTKHTVYFINFDIKYTNHYINGSLSSPKKIPLEDAKKIIKGNVPGGYIPQNFYEAEEQSDQTKTIFILMRNEDEIINEVINV